MVPEQKGVLDAAIGQKPHLANVPWRNLLIQADNAPLLSSLRHGPLRQALEQQGGLKLIYCDPPFAVGKDFTLPVSPASDLRRLAYSDQWRGGLGDFLSMLHERLILMRDLLAPDGSLYLHCDWRSAPYLRVLMDELFGPERFLGDIVWHYTGGGRAKRWFSRKHDRILHYAKGDTWLFNPDAIRVPYAPNSGYAKGGITSAAGKHYMPHPQGTPVDDVWDIPMINPLAAERNGYPTQKPEALLERILLASSRPGDLVADFFCGSGTLPLCAQRLGRAWIGVDSSPCAIHTTRKRLTRLAFDNPKLSCAPFALAVQKNSAEYPPPPGDSASQCHAVPLPGATAFYILDDIRCACRCDKRTLSIDLEGFAVRPAHRAPQVTGRTEARRHLDLFAQLLDAPWTDWLDYWSVGLLDDTVPVPPGCRPAEPCSRVLWQSARRGEQGPELRCPDLPMPQTPSPPRLVVTVVDIFANESRLCLEASVMSLYA
jgi:site-specific DNA-methyltransferase (adenine-specific)/adenine-specific DNA-methyltransferase